MSSEWLIKHFERVADVPDAVQRLRGFILDLAVRGKLVAQDPEDEPASELCIRIREEKNSVADKLRNQKGQPLDLSQIPFSIPANWNWSQLAEIGLINPRNEAKDSAPASFIPMPMIPAAYGHLAQHTVRPWGEIKKGYTHFADGDVGLAKITPCFENGKSIVFKSLTGGLGAGTTELHIVRPFLIVPDYILIFLKSPQFIANGKPIMTGTAGQKRVPRDYFAFSPFALPPLAEQHRIVAKVEELMALCDGLHASQVKRESQRDRLVAATLNGLDNGDASPKVRDGKHTVDKNTRFYFNQFASLTRRAEHIRQLRQTILNLAVRGKLVEQDPEDECVVALLQRIDQERVLESREDRRAEKHVQDLLADELCWEIPPTWRWRALADLALFIDYRGKTPPKVESGVRLITAKNVREGIIDLQPEEFITEATYKSWMTRGLPSKGDILFTTEAPMGKAAVINFSEKFALAQRAICFRLYDGFNPWFGLFQILSPLFQAILISTATGLTAKGIKAAKLKRLPFAVPPLAEQHRIVQKVNELMLVCDHLETQLSGALATRIQLLEATLHEALDR